MNIRIVYEYIFELMDSIYFAISLILGIGVAMNVLALVAKVFTAQRPVEAPPVITDVVPAPTPTRKILRGVLVKRQSTAELARKAAKARARSGPTLEEMDYARRLREDLNRFYSSHDQGQL
jgi:hypothetical protein